MTGAAHWRRDQWVVTGGGFRADQDPKFREDPSRTRHRRTEINRESCPN
jgi:hypothetical protein